MPTLTKHHLSHLQEFPIRDLGLAAALSTSGWPMRLEGKEGVIHFVFQGNPEKFEQIENEYWSGSLELPARDAFQNLRLLKDRLYAAKGSR